MKNYTVSHKVQQITPEQFNKVILVTLIIFRYSIFILPFSHLVIEMWFQKFKLGFANGWFKNEYVV